MGKGGCIDNTYYSLKSNVAVYTEEGTVYIELRGGMDSGFQGLCSSGKQAP